MLAERTGLDQEAADSQPRRRLPAQGVGQLGVGDQLGADEDLAEIWEYIAQDDIEAADRWDAKLRDAFGMLGKSPGLGHARTDLTNHSVLFWPVGAYLILYRVRNRRVEIIAVTQGARDIPSFLRERAQ